MYKQQYNRLTGLADQIREQATQKSTSSQQFRRPRGLMKSIDINYIPEEPQKTQEEILAEYLDSIRSDATTTTSGTDTTTKVESTGPTTRESARPGSSNPVNFSDRELLARTIQAEAGGEGYEGMMAVASVMANRVGDGRFGESFKEVILQPGQFSAWNGVTGYAGGAGSLDMQNMRVSSTAYEIADKILSGDYESPVGTATHYYNPNAATPAWGKIAGGDWQTLGNHIFGSVD